MVSEGTWTLVKKHFTESEFSHNLSENMFVPRVCVICSIICWKTLVFWTVSICGHVEHYPNTSTSLLCPLGLCSAIVHLRTLLIKECVQRTYSFPTKLCKKRDRGRLGRKHTCVSSRHSRKCITLLKLMTELIFFSNFLENLFSDIFF